jgi:hypothetical protein
MSDYSVSSFPTPRDGAGPVTCAVCGCRLQAQIGADDGAWRHFPSLMAGQDARGCRPDCVDALHDRDGRVLMPVEPGRGSSANDAAAA